MVKRASATGIAGATAAVGETASAEPWSSAIPPPYKTNLVHFCNRSYPLPLV